MTDLFLIVHKVRGEPAFDVAQRLPELDEDGEEAWIIPTSGHRAYPYGWMSLGKEFFEFCPGMAKPMPEGWPDHYPCNRSPAPSLSAVLAKLAPPSTIRRRA